jgi:hypothetical protein
MRRPDLVHVSVQTIVTTPTGSRTYRVQLHYEPGRFMTCPLAGEAI